MARQSKASSGGMRVLYGIEYLDHNRRPLEVRPEVRRLTSMTSALREVARMTGPDEKELYLRIMECWAVVERKRRAIIAVRKVMDAAEQIPLELPEREQIFPPPTVVATGASRSRVSRPGSG